MIRISPSQLDTWYCKERWRQHYLLGYEPIKPSIHLAFGSAVHLLTAGYWDGKPYQEAFNLALQEALKLDIRLLNSRETTRWNEMLDSLPDISTAYWEAHGDNWSEHPAVMNEKWIEWEHSPSVICNGKIDRMFGDGDGGFTLVDTKTVSAMDRNWKNTVKWGNLRKPQLPFYLRYCAQAGIRIEKVEIEAIVKPYRGSSPDVVSIDLTKEILAQQERFIQQMDWAIREIEYYRSTMAAVTPWPMNRGLCTTKYSSCDYLPQCDLLVEEGDPKLYVQITEKETKNYSGGDKVLDKV